MAEKKQTKAEAVRAYVEEHPGASRAEVVAALGESGTKITENYVTTIKTRAKKASSKAKKKTSKAKKKAPKKKAVPGKPARAPRRQVPRCTLEEALKVATVIEEKNSGKPWASEEVAAACGTTKSNNAFFYKTAAARDYGLTEGTRDAKEIALTDLGRAIVLPSSPQERLTALRTAFHNVELFKKVDEHYGPKPLPEKRFFSSLVQKTFEVAKDHVDEFHSVFSKNRDFLASQGVGATIPTRTNNSASTEPKKAPPPGVHVTVSTHSKNAFVIMPFSEKGKQERPPGFFQEVLTQIITPAGDRAEFNIQTAMQSGSDVIQSTIIEHLIHADLVIADLTDHNPNVMFELGVRIALDKPIVLIRATGTPGIFDVDNMMRVESYNPLLWVDTVASDVPKIAKHIADGWTRRDSNRHYMEILAGSGWRD